MRVSLVMLTHNRREFLAKTMAHNMANAGAAIDELIWVDNGSTENVRDVMLAYSPDVCVLNKTNLGVAKGYNRGFALATCDYIVVTDDDMLMPDQWLATFLAYLVAIPHTCVARMLHHEIKDLPLRLTQFNGMYYHHCKPGGGPRIVSREILVKKIGYLREDFGLYGWEDVEWGNRAVRVCRDEHLITYSIPGQYAEHLGTHTQDPIDYRAFKTKEGAEQWKAKLVARCAEEGSPYVNPYA